MSKRMEKDYVVTITFSVCAKDENEAWEQAEERFRQGDFDSDSIEIEEDR